MKLNLDKLLQYGPPKYLPKEAEVRYCTNAHNKHEKKNHEANRGPTELLSCFLTIILPPQRSDLLPNRLGRGGELVPVPQPAPVTTLQIWNALRMCWNLIPDSLDQVESQIDSNTIYYFEFQTWNLALQPA